MKGGVRIAIDLSRFMRWLGSCRLDEVGLVSWWTGGEIVPIVQESKKTVDA
jgi:hypothetical protein